MLYRSLLPTPARLLLTLMLCWAVSVSSTRAEGPLAQSLVAHDAAPGDGFGAAVALKLPYLIVGAPGNGLGAAYSFWKDPAGGRFPWKWAGNLIPASLPAGGSFGFSVGLIPLGGGPPLFFGPRIAVGAPSFDGAEVDQGAVYFFGDPAGGDYPTFTAPVPGANDQYGFSLSMEDYLVVGAPGTGGTGAVHLYESEPGPLPQPFRWEYLLTRQDPQSVPDAAFGWAVAANSRTLVAGAPAIRTAAPGKVVIFNRDAGGADNWGAVRRLASLNPSDSDSFGISVALDGDLLAVGSSGFQRTPGVRTGAVYLFAGANWDFIQRIEASDWEHGAAFGSSVALSDGVLAVGAPGHSADTGETRHGAVYLYKIVESRWREIGRIAIPMNVPETFGFRVALEGSTVVGSSPLAEGTGGTDSGTATVYALPEDEANPGNVIANPYFSNTSPPGPLNGGLPTAAGYWGSDRSLSQIIPTSYPGVTQVKGDRVLQFFNTGGSFNPTLSATCDVYQLVDLTPYPGRVASGKVVAHFSFDATRVAGDAETDDQFDLQIRSYSGDPANFPTEITSHTASVDATIHADADPATWETVEAELAVPPGTTYLAVRIAALENVKQDLVPMEFDGHFVDNAALTLRGDLTDTEIVAVYDGNMAFIARHTTTPGFHYGLQKSTDMKRWTNICWGVPGTGNEEILVVPAGRIPETFYRVIAGW